jgi:hypothetical protein
MSLNMAKQPRTKLDQEDDRPWSNKETKMLRENWGKIPTAAIGRLFTPHRSKHSVVGKAHRLRLPEQESPIKRPGEAPKLAQPAPPPPPLTEEEIAWKEFTRWAPGDPSLWPWKQRA